MKIYENKRKWIDINQAKPKIGQEVWTTIAYPNNPEDKPAVRRQTYHGEPKESDGHAYERTDNDREYSRWWMDIACYGARVTAWMPTDDPPEPYIPAINTNKKIVKISKQQFEKIKHKTLDSKK